MSNDQPQKSRYKKAGFGGVGQFPKGKQPENPKKWVDVWPFATEGHDTQSKKILFW